jgi:hypothetical protein
VLGFGTRLFRRKGIEMTKEELRGLVTEGYRLNQEIKALEEKLDAIKQVLITRADGNVIELLGEGCKASVNYSARIDSKVAPEKLPKCKKLAGDFFDKLFCSAPIDKFRDVAKALLGDKGTC